MPGYGRAPVSVELKVVTSDKAGNPQDQVAAAMRAAGAAGLAHEAGPETTIISGNREEVLQAAKETVEAALDAGARAVEIKVEAEADADRFDSGDDIGD